ncbi:MAG: NAD(P) transhydrogenase subunit alpha [Actinobacteria bacterium]|nr:NAD(P) transhydrogenase subunit alpha [Actinomycetota bacterium]
MSRGLDPFVVGIVVFVLASFVGFEVITKVPTTLHTPLMSGSNAISGITIVGALLALAKIADGGLATGLAVAAVVAATINVVGGFLVTDRMLQMFRKPAKKKGEEVAS